MPCELELVRPAMLTGLLAVPLLAWYFHRSLADFARWQRVVSLACRVLIVVLLVLALSGLTLLVPTTRQYVVFALDTSLSIGDTARRETAEYLKQAEKHQGNDAVAFLRFAGSAGRVETEFLPDRLKEVKAQQATNLAAAIEVAGAAIPPFYVPQIVLLSDGNATQGDAIRAAMAARMPISVVPLPTRSDPEVQLSSVEVPAQVQQGEPFNVEVVVDSNHDDQATIDLFRGPHKLLSSKQKLTKGENRFRFRQTLQRDRLAEYSARLQAGRDTLLDNNTAAGLVFAAGAPRVLLVDSNPKTMQELTWSLEQQEIQIDLRPPDGMPDTLADLQNYGAVVLSNVPATALTTRQMELVRTYVQDLGGGLIMLGGDQSFGLGGYYKTAMEDLLPVRSDFEKENEKPSLAMVLVLDKSGSMNGMKIELAKDAAKSAVELLGQRDQIGVIAFDGASYTVSELQNAVNRHTILDRIATLDVGGGTSMYQPMVNGYEALRGVTAQLKHMIVMTDGISAPADFEAITSQMAADNITVSTVAVGEQADVNLLESIARIGHGRFYFCADPYSIPQIFAKETVTASRSALNERPFVPQLVRPTPVLQGIDMESTPLLLGYVVTRPKPTSEVILASPTGEPILAWWRYGLGIAVAFTSDASSRWGAEWLTWDHFGKFWAQIIRHSQRRSDVQGAVVELQRHGDIVDFTLDAVDNEGRFIDQAQTTLTIVEPGLGVDKRPMLQVAPGRYTARFQPGAQGSYHLQITQSKSGQTLLRQTRGLVVGYPDELRLRPSNESLLREIAAVSGGTYDPTPQAVFDNHGRTALRAEALWPYLLMAAATLLVVDVALRRIDLSGKLPLRENQPWQQAAA